MIQITWEVLFLTILLFMLVGMLLLSMLAAKFLRDR
jgi:hypothetical protein